MLVRGHPPTSWARRGPAGHSLAARDRPPHRGAHGCVQARDRQPRRRGSQATAARRPTGEAGQRGPREPRPVPQRRAAHVPPAPAPPPAPRAAAMVLAGPAFRVAPPSQPVGHRPAGARGRAAGTGDGGPRLGTGRGRPGVSATPAPLLRRKKTTDYRNMAAGPPAAAVHAGMMATGRAGAGRLRGAEAPDRLQRRRASAEGEQAGSRRAGFLQL